MDSCRFYIRVVLCAAAVLMVGLAPSAVEAQIGGVGGGIGGGGFAAAVVVPLEVIFRTPVLSSMRRVC